MADPKIKSATGRQSIISVLFTAAQTVGDWIQEANFVGVVVRNGNATKEGGLCYGAPRVNAPQNTALATAGDALFFDITAKDFTLSSTNTVGPIATLLENKAITVLVADIDLFGDLGRRAAESTVA